MTADAARPNRKTTTIPEGARLVLKPVGYVVRRSSRADDLSIVNGARASFARHKSELGPDDVLTPEAAAAAPRGPDGRAPQPGLLYRLLGAGHETPCEQHGMLLLVRDAPALVANLAPDEIDARYDAGRVSFPWTANFRHAMTLHRRTLRAGDEDALSIASAILLRFHDAGVTHGTRAYLLSAGLGLDELRASAAPADKRVEAVANPPTEADAVATVRRHLERETDGLDDGAVVDLCVRRHPNLLNLWVFTWQLRAIIHVFWDLVRHRKSSPNGESGRYSVLLDEWIRLDEDEVRTQKGHPLSYERGTAPPDAAREFAADLDRFNELGVALYHKWVDRKVAREMCAWFEPLSKFRTFVWTFRGLGALNMIGLRNHPTALLELRRYAAEMEADVRAEAPLLAAAFDRNGRRAP